MDEPQQKPRRPPYEFILVLAKVTVLVAAYLLNLEKRKKRRPDERL